MEEIVNDKNNFQKLYAENVERLKELSCINMTTSIIKEGKSIEDTLQQICLILPHAWQFPEYTASVIRFDGKHYHTANYVETKWCQKQGFETLDNKTGTIEIYYLKQFSEFDEGPFLKEERDLIYNIANMITGYINSLMGKQILEIKKTQDNVLLKEPVVNSRQLLQKFLNKYNSDRDIYHDLMPFMVKEILLVANLYDAYSIEKEGRFSEHILGEYYQLSLTSMPRITGVSNYEEAFAQLNTKHFDLVILMVGVDKKNPIEISEKIKQIYNYIPIYILLNNNSDIALFDKKEIQKSIDKIFIWNGDSKVFFAMVKLLEDKVNLENDTKIGMVGVIMLVEDSPKYYSRYLPMLYNVVMEQTKQLIEDVNTDELYKVLKFRARPKILLTSNYEEAIEIFNKYKENLFCLISDVKFPKNGKLCEDAGFELIKYVKDQIETLPTVLQSSDTENAKRAYEMKSSFINKNSETLLQDLKSFIDYYLGFGHFVYRNNEGKQIAVAKSLREFELQLKEIPDESIVYHGLRNHFSLWLMARGEIQIAKKINPYKVKDFKDTKEIRSFILNSIQIHRNEHDKGRIVNFDETAILDETNIVSLESGRLGGKGRGLAFVNTLIYNFNFSQIIDSINIRTPRTSIIGTDEFDTFLDKNKLHQVIHNERNYEKIREIFIKGELSYHLIKRLKIFLKYITKPLAIRSSSLFEDSLMQPFSGIFETYLLPNNHPDLDMRLKQTMDAIKLVFASIYSNNARTYFEAIQYKIEEEKMGVVIQEVVGNQYEDCYYPHISGTAQSHNFYPVAHMKPDEGFAVVAVGLGQYVVEGEKTYRFSPRYPKTDIISNKDLYKSSQVEFYAVNMNKHDLNLIEGEDAGLIKLEISDAERHGAIKHSASVYDIDNDRIEPGITSYGPRVINFANILKYDFIPLAKTIDVILDLVKEALGSPVEIEYAIDLNKSLNNLPSFYLLQIKPLVGNDDDYNIDMDKIDKDKVILFTEKSMGNGKIDDITDIIFADIENFDNTQTLEMTYEIEKLNNEMLNDNKKYILIGPGRWGTRDKFIGVPVAWPQICNAKIIVEISLKDFPLDASLGSHFFHNVTSMNVGYFSIQHSSPTEFIKWDIFNKQKVINKTKYFTHIRFKKPLNIIMDGKKRISLITVGD